MFIRDEVVDESILQGALYKAFNTISKQPDDRCKGCFAYTVYSKHEHCCLTAMFENCFRVKNLVKDSIDNFNC